MKKILIQIKKNSEWFVAIGLVLLSYNFILKPFHCRIGSVIRRPLSSCPSDVLTFISLIIIILGVTLIFRKKANDH